MGIYIKDMKMSESCENCFAYRPTAFYTCSINHRQYLWNFDRPIDCPLDYVPPHGDLIERGALYFTNFEIVVCGHDYKEALRLLLEKIESAPVVIKAEDFRKD